MDRNLLEAALRVLNANAFGQPPAAEDIASLRECAPVSDRRMAPAILATRVIEREIERGRASRKAAAE